MLTAKIETIRNDITKTFKDFFELKVGDLVRVCYQHRIPMIRNVVMGDYCYLVGYIKELTITKMILTNVDPKYPHFRLPFLTKKKTAIHIDDIHELEKIALSYVG